jgi:adenosine deaminase
MLPGHHQRISAKDHHFDWWYKHAQSLISLGTDDVGVFGSESSEEYMLVAEHFGLDEEGLLGISRKAMGGALGSEEDRTAVLADVAQYIRSM